MSSSFELTEKRNLTADITTRLHLNHFRISSVFDVVVFVSHSPLHLAIIHQQTGVIQQLIHTLLNSQQQNILNTANHLRQVATPT